MLENDDLAPLIDQEALAEFRARALNPMNPVARGMAENPDHFFQHRESCNNYYEAVPAIVEEYMNEISKITGRKYGLFDYYGAEDAERVIIAMGSGKFCCCPDIRIYSHRSKCCRINFKMHSGL